MLAIENKILNKQILKFNINLKLEQAFFKKPLSLVALNAGAKTYGIPGMPPYPVG